MGDATLIFIERFAWWFHIIGILGFASLCHLFQAPAHIPGFPNTWYSNLKPKGEMKNMPEVTNEVNMMLGMATESNQEPSY
jgi:hypothetical protein